MLACYLLLCFGLCHSAILTSKDLKLQISEEFLTLHDLEKSKLVDKSWIELEKVYETISVTQAAGLFAHKKTNEIAFQTKGQSWNDIKLTREIYSFQCGLFEENRITQKDIQEKNWLKIFMTLAPQFRYHDLSSVPEVRKFMEVLAEIIELEEVPSKQIYVHKPLHALTELGDVGLMQVLLERGARIDSYVGEGGFTPLLYAVQLNKVTAAKTLLDWGANPNFKSWGGTSLHIAVLFQRPHLVPILLENGAEVDAIGPIDRDSKTALMVTLHYSNSDTCDLVEILLRNGANPLLKDKNGKTAIAYEKMHHKCTRCLLLISRAILQRYEK